MIYLNFICDDADCDLCQQVYFDDMRETFGNAIRFLQDTGWRFEGLDHPPGPDFQPQIKAYCPKHQETT